MDKRIEEIRERLAARKGCDGADKGDCWTDSGPYCGEHTMDAAYSYVEDIEYLLAFADRNTCKICGHEEVEHLRSVNSLADQCHVEDCACPR